MNLYLNKIYASLDLFIAFYTLMSDTSCTGEHRLRVFKERYRMSRGIWSEKIHFLRRFWPTHILESLRVAFMDADDRRWTLRPRTPSEINPAKGIKVALTTLPRRFRAFAKVRCTLVAMALRIRFVHNWFQIGFMQLTFSVML